MTCVFVHILLGTDNPRTHCKDFSPASKNPFTVLPSQDGDLHLACMVLVGIYRCRLGNYFYLFIHTSCQTKTAIQAKQCILRKGIAENGSYLLFAPPDAWRQLMNEYVQEGSIDQSLELIHFHSMHERSNTFDWELIPGIVDTS